MTLAVAGYVPHGGNAMFIIFTSNKAVDYQSVPQGIQN
jgi:hypothetical protein